MTTKKDNHKARVDKLGLGVELSVGVPTDGMQSPTGEYPKREYNFGSSINKAALGTKVNKLYTGGGEIGVPLGIPEQMPSQYPFNQVDETPSGHVIEMDDTPGGERVLIKHRKGSGVELRADGTVVISALNNKVEVTGGDQTVIIEGHGNLVYNGNLNLKVSGDYNVEVGGNYNVKTGGNATKNIKGNSVDTVVGTKKESVHGTNTIITRGNKVDVNLSNLRVSTKQSTRIASQGSLQVGSGSNMFLHSDNKFDISSKNIIANAPEALVLKGTRGVIGGQEMRFTGRTYSGARKSRSKPELKFSAGQSQFYTFDSDGVINNVTVGDSDNYLNIQGSTSDDFETAIFHGDLYGIAQKAQMADNANKSITAFHSSFVASPIPIGKPGNMSVLKIKDLVSNFNMEAEAGHDTVETNEIFNVALGLLSDSDMNTYVKLGKPIVEVLMDEGDFIRDDMKGKEFYEGVFEREPTTAEIRSAFRNPSTRFESRDLGDGTVGIKPSKLAKLLAVQKRNPLINPNALIHPPIPPKLTGRVVNKETSSKYGFTPIGNSIDNRGKRFRK